MKLVFEKKMGLNCLEYLIKGICDYYKTGYELMFLGSWGFEFNSKLDIKDKNFIKSNESNSKKLLLKYYNIKIKTIEFDNFQEYKSYVCEKIKNEEIVVVSVDLFWVPWTTNEFQIKHWNHALLITDTTEDGFICHDYFSNGENIISFKNLEKCFNKVFVFSCTNESLNTYSYLDILLDIKNNLLSNLISINAFSKIKKMSEIFNEDFMPKKIFSEIGDLQNGYFMEEINRLAECRFQFSIVLEYLGNNHNDSNFIFFSKKLNQCAIQWKTVWGMLQKSFVMDNEEKIIRKISERVYDIACIEEKISSELLEYILSKMENNNDESDKDAMYLDLDKAYNHKGMAYLENPQQANFDEGFIVVNQQLMDKFLNKGHYFFRIADITDSNFDNIMCVGQELEINRRSIEISFLLASEFSHQNELFEIYFDNNVKLVLQLASTVCCGLHPMFGEEIMWEGSLGYKRSSGIELDPSPIYFFAKRYILENYSVIKKIKLPYCPALHIFAITTFS